MMIYQSNITKQYKSHMSTYEILTEKNIRDTAHHMNNLLIIVIYYIVDIESMHNNVPILKDTFVILTR